jgi:hypothetical protein
MWAQKQPTHLPTQFELPSASNVRILRPWQTTQSWLSIQDDCQGAIRPHSAYQSISTFGV